MHWYSKKTEAYSTVCRGFLRVGTDVRSEGPATAKPWGTPKESIVGKPGHKRLVQIAGKDCLSEVFTSDEQFSTVFCT